MSTTHPARDELLGLAPPVRRTRGDGLVLGAVWIGAAVALTGVAAVQVHPGGIEDVVIAVIWIVAATLSLIVATTAQIRRWAPPVLLLSMGVVGLATWDPWHLAALDLVFAHPEVLATMAALGLLVLARRREPTVGASAADACRRATVLAGVALVVVGVVGAAWFVLVAAGPHDPYRSREVGGVRVDHHDVGEQGRAQVVVLRSGSGLTMREAIITRGWFPNVVVEPRNGAIEVCVVGTRSWTRFDPETLDVLGAPGGPPC